MRAQTLTDGAGLRIGADLRPLCVCLHVKLLDLRGERDQTADLEQTFQQPRRPSERNVNIKDLKERREKKSTSEALLRLQEEDFVCLGSENCRIHIKSNPK
ncbi:hypothetical protein LDENG_00169730 [Lucifuga dentata]|nr:hypothetical protein LDENG_00169730 [Lucifuga dentata]